MKIYSLNTQSCFFRSLILVSFSIPFLFDSNLHLQTNFRNNLDSNLCILIIGIFFLFLSSQKVFFLDYNCGCESFFSARLCSLGGSFPSLVYLSLKLSLSHFPLSFSPFRCKFSILPFWENLYVMYSFSHINSIHFSLLSFSLRSHSSKFWKKKLEWERKIIVK